MRPDLELEVDLPAGPSVRSSTFQTLALGSASTLPTPAIEDHLDVPVVAEPI